MEGLANGSWIQTVSEAKQDGADELAHADPTVSPVVAGRAGDRFELLPHVPPNFDGSDGEVHGGPHYLVAARDAW